MPTYLTEQGDVSYCRHDWSRVENSHLYIGLADSDESATLDFRRTAPTNVDIVYGIIYSLLQSYSVSVYNLHGMFRYGNNTGFYTLFVAGRQTRTTQRDESCRQV